MFQRNLFKEKKGELTTQQIIILIILVISFVVLLYFLFVLNPAETSSKQVCYNSVVLISKGQGLIGSLDCNTNYLCISGGDSCTNFNPTATVEINTENKNEILKAIADEMADCWWMFGEGKVDYIGKPLGGDPRCAVCSRIKFDEKIQSKIKEITYSELYDYMKTHQSSHDTSQNYLKYLYGVSSLEFSNTETKEFNVNSVPINTDKDYIIITGIDPEPPLISDKYIKVNIVNTDEAIAKTRCEIFDITKA